MITTDRTEINITRHCNNHCSCCNHGSPLAKPYYMEPETLRRDLAMLKPFWHTGFLCLQGGEPLLHPKIMELLDVQQKSGVASQYGMLSNGRLLEKMPDEFFQKCGQMRVGDRKFELRVSVYANFDIRRLAPSIEKANRCGFEIRPGPTPTFWKLFYDQPDGGKAAWATCYARGCHTVHEGYWYHCPLACFFPAQFFGWDEHIDGIKIEGLTEAKLAEFIAHPEPLKTCGKCTAGGRGGIPWHEETNPEKWLREATV